MHVAGQLERTRESPADSKPFHIFKIMALIHVVLLAAALLLLQRRCTPAGSVGAVHLQQTRHKHKQGDHLDVEALQMKSNFSREASGPAAVGLDLAPSTMECSGSTFSKRSCLFSSVCLQLDEKQQLVTAWLINPRDPERQAAVLQQHLNWTFHDSELYSSVTTKVVRLPGDMVPSSSSSSTSILKQQAVSTTASSSSSSTLATTSNLPAASILSAHDGDSSAEWDPAAFEVQDGVTMLWRNVKDNQGSFGHALVNEAFPMYLVLQNHFGHQLPSNLQLLATPTMEHVLHQVIKGTITQQAHLMQQHFAELPQGRAGICCRQLLVGAGGYQRASRASLANSNIYQGYSHANHHTSFSREPSFFSSSNWWSFRQHTLQMHGVHDSSTAAGPPLVLLNDKRHGPEGKPDRRSIIDVDGVATNLSAALPGAQVQAVRFRDLPWADQLLLLSRTKVFVTTQGSSAFRLVFMPKGSVCIMVGAPEPTGSSVWTSFHELDRWFPLTYVQFIRYEVSVAHEAEYNVTVWPDVWQPDEDEDGGKTRRAWWLYNADIHLDMQRLLPMVESALPQL